MSDKGKTQAVVVTPVVAELVKRAQADGMAVGGEGGLLQQLTKLVLESSLEGELDAHLGCGKHDPAGRDGGNSRNGKRAKTVLTEAGPVEVEVPRDRDGSFEPTIVRKRQRRLGGIDGIVLSLTAKGLTTGEISAHLAEVYGASVSKDTISTITDPVLEGMAEWHNRPLDPVYPVIFVDAIRVKIRDGQVANRPVYLALGVTVNGERDILGLCAGEHGDGEGAKYWLRVLTEIKNRGIADVPMVVCDGLKGLPDAVTAVWDKTIVQTSSVHNDLAGVVPVVTCTVSGRTYASPVDMSTCGLLTSGLEAWAKLNMASCSDQRPIRYSALRASCPQDLFS
jgi:transposase-like protein